MPAPEKSPSVGSYEYWNDELRIASKELKEKFQDKGDKVNKRFLDERQDEHTDKQRLNLFHANVVTLRSMLYGQTPLVEASRRFQDQNDDVGRVAADIFQRLLNNDIALTTDSFQDSLRSALDDFLIPGLGCCRVRYDVSLTKENVVQSETTEFEYIYWKDILWSPSRTWKEVRWLAFRTYVTREEADKNFKPEVAEYLNYKSRKLEEGEKQTDPEKCAEIWEIWCKDTRKIYWYNEGYDKLVGTKDDPLKLSGFWPCPRPMMANITTTKLLPKPDYSFAQDLYEEIDELETRIHLLTRACKVVGAYDKTNEGLQRLLNEATENQLIPVDNWSSFSEKGGIKGVVDWLPIEVIANVINILTQKLQEKINLLYQVTGMSDILRGATDPRETKGAQELKSKYASVRIQAMQDMFAEFASDLQRIKAEIVSRHYSPETIKKQANTASIADQHLIPAALDLIKNPEDVLWRINVRPESVAMIDYAQLKQERTEYLMAISQFMQSAAPLLQVSTGIAPYLLELLKWGLAGFKGANSIEGVLDKAIEQAQIAEKQKASQPPPPDPKVEALKMKAQADMQQAQQESQLKMQELQAEMQMDMQRFRAEMQMEREKFELEKQKMMLDIQMKQQELGMKREEMQMDLQGKVVDMQLQRQSAESNLEATEAANQQKLKSAEAMSKIKAKQAAKPKSAKK